MAYELALSLTKELIQINTVNPPGNEKNGVDLLAPLLKNAGFSIKEHIYGDNRSSLIAHIGNRDKPSIMLSGHLDTVPFGAQPWAHPPLGSEIIDGKLYGRGAADMKGGVAVLVASAIEMASKIDDVPLTLVLSSDEEIGCAGVAKLLADKVIPKAKCILVAEPTGNVPCLGHKGVLWLKILFHGKTAHAAFPELGDNALIKAAQAVITLNSNLKMTATHPVMGQRTLVTSRIKSGDNYNSVPDLAELGVDIRSTVNQSNKEILQNIKTLLEPLNPEIEVLFDLPALWTEPDLQEAQNVFAACDSVEGTQHTPRIVTFYTDGGLLGPGLGNVPVIILGPGASGMAHKVDEYVEITDLNKSADLYVAIISRLCLGNMK